MSVATGGFQTVALVGFIAPLAVTLLGPATGQLLDHSPRQLALNTCALVQGVCIIISGQFLPPLLPSLCRLCMHWFSNSESKPHLAASSHVLLLMTHESSA